MLLCPINWGTQCAMEISSKEEFPLMAIEKKSKFWGPFWSYQLNKQHCQFSLFTAKKGPNRLN